MTPERELLTHQEDTINISYHQDNVLEGRILSNLAPTPFILDGKEYASIEGFWQGLYFPEDSTEREDLSHMFGRKAKVKGLEKPEGLEDITYQGDKIVIGSLAHQALMRQALEAKIDQNEDVKVALLSTGNKTLTHILKRPDGTLDPDSRSIPAHIFTGMLMQIREKLREAK